MKTSGRFATLALALVLSLGACTGDGDDGDGGAATGDTDGATGASGGDVGPTPVVSGAAASGTYEYENAGLRVVLHIEGTTGTMEVDNGTERELPQPDFYILDARDGHEIEGEVTGAAPVPSGQTQTFEISFSGIEVREIGAIALLLGSDNYGLFVRTA